eukprot:g3331.t1
MTTRSSSPQLRKQIDTARSLASKDPSRYGTRLSTEDAGECVLEKRTQWSKKFVPCVASADGGMFTCTSPGVLWSKTKRYDMSSLSRFVVRGPREFALTLHVEGKTKELFFRCQSNEDMNRWKTCLLLNACLRRSSSAGSPAEHGKKTSTRTTVAPPAAASSATRPSRKKIPPVPDWLRGDGATQRLDLHRVKSRVPDVLRFATELRHLQANLTFTEGWPWAAWGVAILQHVLESIRSGSTSTASSREILTPTFFMSLLTINGKIKEKEALYQRVVKVFEDYRKNVVMPAIASKTKGPEMLREFVHRWELHKIFAEYMRRIFIDLDKNTDGKKRPSVSSIAIRNFAELWIVVKDRLVDAMLDIVRAHRMGGESDGNDDKDAVFLKQCKEILCVMGVVEAARVEEAKCLVCPTLANSGHFVVMPEIELLSDATTRAALNLAQRKVVKIVVADHLGFYRDQFEDVLIETSRAYCARRRAEWTSCLSPSRYLSTCIDAIADEARRVNAYLHPSTAPRLLRCFVRCLLASEDGDFETRLVQDEDAGVLSLLRANHLDQVAQFYDAFLLAETHDDGRSVGLDRAAAAFGQWVRGEAESLCRSRAAAAAKTSSSSEQRETKKKKKKKKKSRRSDDMEFVERLLDISRRSVEILGRCFNDSPRFLKESNAAFEQVLNKQNVERSLVEYAHALLLKGKDGKGQRKSLDERKFVTFEILDVYDHLYSKDMFLDAYWRRLQDRLLTPGYVSYQLESEILSRLKLKTGQVSRMEMVLKDATRVKTALREWISACAEEEQVLQPLVIGDTHWSLPPTTVTGLKLPPKIERAMDAYRAHYGGKYEDRSLDVCHDVSNVVMSYACGKKTYRVSATAPQACALLLFSSFDLCLSFATIQERLGLGAPDTEAILVTLLRRLPKSRSAGLIMGSDNTQPTLPLKDTDSFSLNRSFVHPRLAFSLKRPAFAKSKRTTEKADAEDAQLNVKRVLRNEAAMVRHMKTSRTMSERDLIDATLASLSKYFKPGIAMVKKAI